MLEKNTRQSVNGVRAKQATPGGFIRQYRYLAQVPEDSGEHYSSNYYRDSSTAITDMPGV